MKHSSSNLMTDSCDPKIVMPSNGHWNSVLKGLYVDLFNLIVESRIPGINERGYGDGCHCPSSMGQNVHLCDLMKPECQKHQRLIHHLLRAVRHNVFEIDVLMLPDCCSELSLSERIESKEYILLERWSMKSVQRSKSGAVIEIPELLRAVRSFLHFSQISAWFSLTKGKSPANIYYWVKPTSAPSSAQFQSNPEVHLFPACKVIDSMYGILKVNYPARKQFIPKIPCSKHPTHYELTFRTKSNYQELTQNIPLNPSAGKQLQNTCDNQLTVITAKQSATDSEVLKASEPILKTNQTCDISNMKKGNRILKHANFPLLLQNTPKLISNSSSCSQISKKKEKNSNSRITNMNNFKASASQENLCSSKETLTTCLSRKECKLNLLNNIMHPSFCERNSMPNETAHKYLPEQSANKHCDQSSKLSNSKDDNMSDTSLLLVQSDETSQNITESLYNCQLILNKQKMNENRLEPFKRKQKECDDIDTVSRKKQKSLICKKIEKKESSCKEYIPQNIIYQRSLKRKLHQPSIISKKVKLNAINTALVEDKNIAQECIKFDFQKSSTPKLKAKGICAEENSAENNSLKQWKLKIDNLFCDSNITNVNKTNIHSKSTLINSSEQNLCKRQINETNFKIGSYHLNHSSSLSAKNGSNKSSPVLFHQLDLPSLTVSPENGFKTSNLKNIDNVATAQTVIQKGEEFLVDEETNKVPLEHTIFNVLTRISSKQVNSYKSTKDLVSKAALRSNRKKVFHPVQDISENTRNMLMLESKMCPSKTSSELKDSKNKSINDTLQIEKNENFLTKYLLQDEKMLEQQNVSKSCDLDCSSNCISKEDIPVDGLKNQTTKKDLDFSSNNPQMPVSGNKTSFINNKSSNLLCKVLPQKATSYHDCFPRNKLKFARGRKLLGNFEESILKGCLPSVNNVKGFHAEIGASGSFCPNHITLPAEVSFYDLDSLNAGTSSYMAHVDLGEKEYYLPKKGAVQVTLFNPSETVVKMFVLNYDLSDMPPMCHTFIRQKTYYMPIGSTEECSSSKKWLRFVIHLRFASTKTGKVYLHKDFKIIVLNKSNDDAASEFSQQPRELRSFLHVPLNPTFSNL